MRFLRSKWALALALPIAALVNVLVVAPAQASGASQIVLSCSTPPPHSHNTNGCSSSELVTTPPIIEGTTLYIIGGFWVWCQNPSANNTPYGPDCNGSTYIEEVNLATGVGKYQATSISGTASPGSPLTVTFTTSDNDMSCTLDVIRGVTTLGGFCEGVPITFSKAVVNVT